MLNTPFRVFFVGAENVETKKLCWRASRRISHRLRWMVIVRGLAVAVSAYTCLVITTKAKVKAAAPLIHRPL